MFIHQNWINKSYNKLQKAMNVCDDCSELTKNTHYIIRSLFGYKVICDDRVGENALYSVTML